MWQSCVSACVICINVEVINRRDYYYRRETTKLTLFHRANIYAKASLSSWLSIHYVYIWKWLPKMFLITYNLCNRNYNYLYVYTIYMLFNAISVYLATSPLIISLEKLCFIFQPINTRMNDITIIALQRNA